MKTLVCGSPECSCGKTYILSGVERIPQMGEHVLFREECGYVYAPLTVPLDFPILVAINDPTPENPL